MCRQLFIGSSSYRPNTAQPNSQSAQYSQQDRRPHSSQYGDASTQQQNNGNPNQQHQRNPPQGGYAPQGGYTPQGGRYQQHSRESQDGMYPTVRKKVYN